MVILHVMMKLLKVLEHVMEEYLEIAHVELVQDIQQIILQQVQQQYHQLLLIQQP